MTKKLEPTIMQRFLMAEAVADATKGACLAGPEDWYPLIDRLIEAANRRVTKPKPRLEPTKAQRRVMVDILCNNSDCFSRKSAKAIVAEMITAANLGEGSSIADGLAEYGRGESVSSDWIADPIVTPMTRAQAHEFYAATARHLYPDDTELHKRIAELDTTE
ncbi:hypothetical protein [Mycobacteroides abscessus]|uniref:hypothetical protein n=1 Tax=Mycobacteroides abscessus TaxID=36809 RepID=UPI00092A0C94|nr:hypothetical protein [Mycobacteroides abscessus]QSM05114.1 hypothetical protein PROPHIGD102-1_13 [Mycobacterium phage prophiGD102-1]MDM3911014.1 hypothetical protein [Mycobacteroides abscessus]MDM3919168.1 hypothetical protein [Mycobacteroides abscessus]MDO3044187.1 hypothetical protein [Mycobacteroides abscessus subsp. abscessus]MDO3135648.1 hypothetical protein [Mycobacteroides abscessus subsp. abscessus]